MDGITSAARISVSQRTVRSVTDLQHGITPLSATPTEEKYLLKTSALSWTLVIGKPLLSKTMPISLWSLVRFAYTHICIMCSVNMLFRTYNVMVNSALPPINTMLIFLAHERIMR